MGARLSEDEVQRALDFCVHLFDPTTPEQHAAVRRKLEVVTGVTFPIPPTPEVSVWLPAVSVVRMLWTLWLASLGS